MDAEATARAVIVQALRAWTVSDVSAMRAVMAALDRAGLVLAPKPQGDA